MKMPFNQCKRTYIQRRYHYFFIGSIQTTNDTWQPTGCFGFCQPICLAKLQTHAHAPDPYAWLQTHTDGSRLRHILFAREVNFSHENTSDKFSCPTPPNYLCSCRLEDTTRKSAPQNYNISHKNFFLE